LEGQFHVSDEQMQFLSTQVKERIASR